MATKYPSNGAGAWSSRTWKDDSDASDTTAPTSSDIVKTNNVAISLDVNIDIGGLNNAVGTNAAAGGSLTCGVARTITINGTAQAAGAVLITLNHTSGNTVTFAGTSLALIGGSSTSAYCANNSSTGTVSFSGTATTTGGSAATAHGINNASTGTITGTALSSVGGTNATAAGISSLSAGTVSLLNTTGGGTTGGPGMSITGGAVTVSGTALGSATNFGLTYTGTTAVTVNNATGGTVAGVHGVFNNSTTATTIINGTVTGGSAASGSAPACGVFINTTSDVKFNGPITASANNPAIGSTQAVTCGKVHVAAGVTITNITGSSSSATMAIMANKVALYGTVTWVFATSSGAPPAVGAATTTLGAGGAAMVVFSGN